MPFGQGRFQPKRFMDSLKGQGVGVKMRLPVHFIKKLSSAYKYTLTGYFTLMTEDRSAKVNPWS